MRNPSRATPGLHMLRTTGVLLELVLAATGATSASAQEGPPGGRRVAARELTAAVLDPDTVRVGEPFTLAISAAAPREADVEFPPLLPLGPELEQLRPVEARWDRTGGGRWRARYRLVAWEAGLLEMPVIRVSGHGSGSVVRGPAVHVVSVLPAASEGPQQLRPPRGPLARSAFPWWLLLLALALAALGWILHRMRGHRADGDAAIVDPTTEVRRALTGLKVALEAGDLDLAAYYDGLEAALRRYLGATRAWPEHRPVRDFFGSRALDRTAPEHRTRLLEMRDRAGLVRFAHVAAAARAALDDADACLAWVGAEEEAA